MEMTIGNFRFEFSGNDHKIMVISKGGNDHENMVISRGGNDHYILRI